MAKRKYSIRYHKRKNNRSNSKRGGEGTPPYESVQSHVGPLSLYNPKTGEKITQKVQVPFINPNELLQKKNKSAETKYNWKYNDNISAKEVFDEPAGFFTDEAINARKRDAALAEFNKLTEDYKKITEDHKPSRKETACENGKECTIMGGRKSRRRKKHTKQSRRYRSKR